MEELLKEILNKIDNNHKEIMEKLQSFEDRFEEIEAKNAIRHLDIDEKLNLIAKDVKFIKHKEFENEQDIFDIKDKLKIVR